MDDRFQKIIDALEGVQKVIENIMKRNHMEMERREKQQEEYIRTANNSVHQEMDRRFSLFPFVKPETGVPPQAVETPAVQTPIVEPIHEPAVQRMIDAIDKRTATHQPPTASPPPSAPPSPARAAPTLSGLPSRGGLQNITPIPETNRRNFPRIAPFDGHDDFTIHVDSIAARAELSLLCRRVEEPVELYSQHAQEMTTKAYLGVPPDLFELLAMEAFRGFRDTGAARLAVIQSPKTLNDAMNITRSIQCNDRLLNHKSSQKATFQRPPVSSGDSARNTPYTGSHTVRQVHADESYFRDRPKRKGGGSSPPRQRNRSRSPSPATSRSASSLN